MSNHPALFRLDQNNTLTFSVEATEDFEDDLAQARARSARGAAVTKLHNEYFAEINDSEDPDALSFDMGPQSKLTDKIADQHQCMQFIRWGQALLRCTPSGQDQVLGLDTWTESALFVDVHPRLQRFLNSDGFDISTCWSVLNVMESGYCPAVDLPASEGFEYGFDYFELSGGNIHSSYFGNSVNLRSDGFVMASGESIGFWRHVALQLSVDAGIGASAHERKRVLESPGSKALYRMGYHNIDYPEDSLRLFMALARLADIASIQPMQAGIPEQYVLDAE